MNRYPFFLKSNISQKLVILMVTVVLSACGGGGKSNPKNPDNPSSSSSSSSNSSSSTSSSSSSSSSSGDVRTKILGDKIPLGLHFSTLTVAIGSNNYKIPFAIDLKSDGDGEWLTAAGVVAFSWVDSGELVSIELTDAVVNDSISVNESYLTDGLADNDWVPGKLFLDALNISISIPESAASTFQFQPSVRFQPDIAEPIYNELTVDNFTYTDSLIDAANAPRPEEFSAGSWFYNHDNVVNQLEVDSNGSAAQKSLDSEGTTQYWANWQVQQNRLELSQVNSNASYVAALYILEDLDVGYRWARIDDKAGEKSFSTGLLIKEDESLTITKADWIGVWEYDQNLVMFTSNNFRRYNIAGWKNEWAFDAASQSLKWSAYQQGANSWRDFCNPLSAYPCSANPTEELRLVAKSGNHYWMLKSENFIPDVSGRINRSLTLTQKVSPLKAFGDWIHNTATNFYEATQSGHRAWTFYRHHLLISDTHRDFFSEQDQDAIKFDISEGKIYLNGNQTDEVIEMLEQSESGILVCKYAMESSCVPGTEFWLLNTSPATMSVAVEGGGFVDYATEYEHFGKTRELTVTPATGYEVKKVEGCDGHLSGNVYLTAPIRKDCTVVASFQKME